MSMSVYPTFYFILFFIVMVSIVFVGNAIFDFAINNLYLSQVKAKTLSLITVTLGLTVIITYIFPKHHK